MPVPEIAWIETLDSLIERYTATYGVKPFNLSHWDPSAEWKANFTGVQLSTTKDVIDYIYSEFLNVHPRIQQRLGIGAGKSSFLANNGTTGIACALNYVKRLGAREIHVVSPSYYAVDHQAKVLGLELTRSFLCRDENGFHLPSSLAALPPGAMVWITNPVFCTSVYYSHSDLELLRNLLAAGVWIFADECLAMHGRELSRELGHFERFVGIYTPHKSVCVNGMKFAVIVGPPDAHSAFQEWSDVFAGGLAVSTKIAAKHFLSNHYGRYQQHVRESLVDRLQAVRRLLSGFADLQSDQATDGHFIMCYAQFVDAELARDEDFLWELMSASGSIIYPGIRNHFDPAWGFCFRINLARYSKGFETSLHRVLLALAEIGRG
jgi:aspartate/methionine/tyrosine aminotransferase